MAWQFASGNILTAADLNAVTKPWNAFCQVRMSTPQSLTNNTTTTLLFDTEDLDPLGWHSTSTFTGRITPNIAGWYEARGTIAGAADADYTRAEAFFWKNAGNLTPIRGFSYLSHSTGAVIPDGSGTSNWVLMNGSSDYMELTAIQVNTSANANTVDATFSLQLQYPT
jgi:hypothetical protein